MKQGETQDTDGDGGALDFYDMSLLISGALWEYYLDEGFEAPHVIQIATNDLPTSSAPDFMDLRNALETAANGCWRSSSMGPTIFCCTGTCSDKVEDALDAHSITQAVADTTARYYDPDKQQRNSGRKYLIFENKYDELTIPMTFQVDAYPNPFNGQVNISVALPFAGLYHVKVVDLLGRIVYEKKGSNEKAGVRSFRWTPINVATGTYYYKVTHARKTISGSVLYLK